MEPENTPNAQNTPSTPAPTPAPAPKITPAPTPAPAEKSKSAFSPSPAQPNKEPFWNPMRIGAGLIILLMLLSGIAVFVGSQNTGQNQDTVPTEQGTQVYIADELEGSVLQTFPSMIVAGQTNEIDKTVLDIALSDIPGITSLTSQFTQTNPVTGERTYRADLVLDGEADKDAIVNAVYELELFPAPEVYFQALVRVPTSFSAVDLQGTPKDITLPSTQIEGLVSQFTNEGDTISGGVIVFFQSGAFFGATMVESQNISQSPTPFFTSLEGEIIELKPTLSIAGTIDYSPLFTQDYLDAGLLTIPGVADVGTLLAPQINNTLFISLNDANTLEGPIKLFAVENATKYSNPQIFPTGFSYTLGNVSVEQAQAEIQAAVNEWTLTDQTLNFTPPLTQFLIDVNTSEGTNILSTADAIQAYFAGWDATLDVQAFQSGIIAAETLVLEETGESYPIPDGQVSAVLIPGHAVGEMVTVLVNGVIVDNTIGFISGVEDDTNQNQI